MSNSHISKMGKVNIALNNVVGLIRKKYQSTNTRPGKVMELDILEYTTGYTNIRERLKNVSSVVLWENANGQMFQSNIKEMLMTIYHYAPSATGTMIEINRK